MRTIDGVDRGSTSHEKVVKRCVFGFEIRSSLRVIGVLWSPIKILHHVVFQGSWVVRLEGGFHGGE